MCQKIAELKQICFHTGNYPNFLIFHKFFETVLMMQQKNDILWQKLFLDYTYACKIQS